MAYEMGGITCLRGVMCMKSVLFSGKLKSISDVVLG